MRLARVAGSYATQPKELEELLRRRIDPVKEPDLYAFSQVVLGMSRKEAEKILGRSSEDEVTWENTTYEQLPLLMDHPGLNRDSTTQPGLMDPMYVCMHSDAGITEWLHGTDCGEQKTALTRVAYSIRRPDYYNISIRYVFDVVVGRSFSYPDGTVGSP